MKHGDGIEEAFLYSPSVFSVSIHGYYPGFFPGTGRYEEIGKGNGKYHNLNIPVERGLSDTTLADILDSILPKIKKKFKPDVAVIVLGADGLSGDPFNEWNLSEKGLVHVIDIVKEWDIPFLVLGGGGYNNANVSRAWTCATATCLEKNIAHDIPDNKYFEMFLPSGEVFVDTTNIPDKNKSELLAKEAAIRCNL